MKNVLVTGANGFVGSWLVNKLVENKIRVYAVIRNDSSDISNIKKSSLIQFIYCEMKNYLELEKELSGIEIDTVYHFAWEGVGGEKRSDYNIQLQNVKGACDCMTISSKLGCEKFLCAGTISEKIVESINSIETIAENNIYAISKCTTHNILKVLSRKFSMQLIWLRLANAYGPNNKSGNIVNYILDKFKDGEAPELSKGEQPYDLVYVEDLADAMYLLGNKNVKKNEYYLGSGDIQTLRELVIRIRDAYPKKVEVKFGIKPEDGLVFKKEWFEINDLTQDTGYSPCYPLEKGIQKTVKELY